MIYGIHLSAQGAIHQSSRLNVVSNNLANAQTTGFKKDLMLFSAHPSFDARNPHLPRPPGNLEEATGGLSVSGVATDFSDGPLRKTGRMLDVALTGPGFLQVADADGNPLLTRDGRLTRNAAGQLALQDTGHAVLGANGNPLTIPPESTEISISAGGMVSHLPAGSSEWEQLGQLALVSVPDTNSLQKQGDGLFQTPDQPQPATADVSLQQGFLEGSGIQPIQEMLQMIEATRAVETNLSMVRTQDEALGRLLQATSR